MVAITVYADLFFLINFSMDFLCLYLTSKLLNLPLRTLRGLLAAGFGGAYAVAALFFPFGYITCLLLDALAALFLCIAAFFQPKEWRRLPLYTIVYIAISAVLGGFMTVLFNFFNRLPVGDWLKTEESDGISVWLFAILAALSGLITLLGGRLFTAKLSRRQVFVELTFSGKTVRLPAFTDSGNLLREPISGKPCIVVDANALSPILPKRVISVASKADAFALDGLPEELRRRLLLIPADTATGGGILLGIRMDKTAISYGKDTKEVSAIAALSKISTEGASALVPSCLLMG